MVTPLGCQIRKELQISLQEKTVKNDVDENLWQVFVFLQGWRSQAGGGGQWAMPAPNFGILVVTLSQPGGHILPTTLLLAPPPPGFQTFPTDLSCNCGGHFWRAQLLFVSTPLLLIIYDTRWVDEFPVKYLNSRPTIKCLMFSINSFGMYCSIYTHILKLEF